MGTPDDLKSLTPTELYAMEYEGAPPGGDTAYQRFKDTVSNAYLANKRAAVGTADAVAKLQAWKDRNPLVKYGTDVAPMLLHPGAGMIGASIAAGQAAAAPSKPLNEPVAPEEMGKPREPTDFKRDFNGPTAPVSALPDYKQSYAMSPGMGGSDVTSGYGTDKALLGAQLDNVADITGLQEKRGEEATAHLQSLSTAADLKMEYAKKQQEAANAYESAVQKSEAEQRQMMTNMQQATDEVSSRGIDPGRFYKNRDTMWWANMLVGSIASGVLNAMSGRGGENTFLQYVRGMVQDDIQSQDKAIDQGWKKVKGMETAYERMRQLGVDRVTATGKQYDMTLQAFQTEIQARLAKAQLPEEKARLEGALQEIQIERDKEAVKLQEYWKAVHERRASAAAAAIMAQRNAERQARLDKVEMDLKRSQTDENYAKADKLRAESGQGGVSKEDAERIRSLQAGYTSVENEIRKLSGGAPGSATSSIPGVSSIPGTDAQKYRQGVEEWNARATVLLGPIVEAMNKGKPGAVELHDLQSRVLIPSERTPMSERIARMKYLQKLQQEAAATMNQPLQQPAAFGEGASTFKPRSP